MASLDSLPVDIKLVILLHIPDYPTILSLTSVSRGFYTTFRRYEYLISPEPLYTDALFYQEESFFLACYSKLLHSGVALKWQEFRRIADSYVDAEQASPASWDGYTLRTYSRQFYDGDRQEMKSRLIENHKLILQHVEYFIKTEKYPRLFRNSPNTADSLGGATAEERSLLIRAFYRLWILILIYNSVIIGGGFGNKLWYIYDDNLHLLLKAWGFWRVKHIQIVAMHLRERMKPVWKHFQPSDEDLLEQFSGEYLWEGRKYPDGMPYGEDPLKRAEYFYHKFNYTALLLHSFPHSTLTWLTSSSKPKSLTHLFTPHSALVLESTHLSNITNGPDNKNRLYNCLFFPDRLFDAFRLPAITALSNPQKIAFDFFDAFALPAKDSDNFKTRAPIPLIRLCNPTRSSQYHSYYLKRGPQASTIAWLGLELSNPASKDSDYYGAVWSEERLKAWGYQFPVFERGSWDVVRKLTDKMVQRFDAMTTMDESVTTSAKDYKIRFVASRRI